MLKGMLKEELMSNPLRMAGAFIAQGAFKGVKNRIPVEKYSGAPLLGLNNLVVKGHGSSDSKQVAGALNIAIQCVRHDLNRKIAEDVSKIREAALPAKQDSAAQ